MKQLKTIYKSTAFPPLKVIVTGTGRVGHGAVDVLKDMGFQAVTPDQFLTTDAFDTPVYTVLSPHHYARRKDGGAFHQIRILCGSAAL
jgi:saccharopine dehydrogenase (NAD+, L-lysine forming)